MSSSATIAQRRKADLGAMRRLLVTVRRGDGPGHRLYRPVGFLTCSDRGYEFAYIRATLDDPEFIPLAGFGDIQRRYRSPELFPQFAQRVMSANRPDRPRYLEALDLDANSEPWEILARSGGRRAGDTVEVMAEPVVSPSGHTECSFLVHGIKHRGLDASTRIMRLQPHDELQLRWDEGNTVNSRAVLVSSDDEIELGYVPDPLVDYVHEVMQHRKHRLLVVRANGPEVGPHLRLLVRLEGDVDPSFKPFGSTKWEILA